MLNFASLLSGVTAPSQSNITYVYLCLSKKWVTTQFYSNFLSCLNECFKSLMDSEFLQKLLRSIYQFYQYINIC
jgi:hypothetical protein